MKKFIIVILIFINWQSFSQLAILDTNNILIGQQTTFTISCSYQKSENIKWPIFIDTIVDGVEIVKQGEIDSIENENNIEISQEFLITSFDSGSYYISAIEFSKTKISNAILLNVNTILLKKDAELKDIKTPLDAPYGWSDVWPWLVGLLILGLIIYLLKKFVFNRKVTEEKVKRKVVIPSDIVALDALKNLKKKQLWQNGKIKEYQSQISDIIRTYLEERFSILALELPTYDILESLKNDKIKKEEKKMIKIVLQRADLAKYAKGKPIDIENEESMKLSIDFVNKTKRKEVNYD